MPGFMTLSAVEDVFGTRLGGVAFNQIAIREGMRHLHRAAFPAAGLTVEQLSVLGDVVLAERFPEGPSIVLRLGPEMIAFLDSSDGRGEIAVAGMDRDAVDRVAADLIATLRDPQPPSDEVVVTFWAFDPGRPLSPRRRIAAPAWDEIRSNYGERVQPALDELMRATEPGPGGLLLWHGEPGTGKSHALRALAREWRGWCDTHFITDAEAFLGGHASYLLDALQHSRHGGDEERWRLIVLEDAGELLAADARAVAGQALSRLLNVSDGVLGSGLRAIVLVTTNEPLRKLHPAIVRPGRTWAEVEFPALNGDEANAWLAERGSGTRVDRETSLAEAFALLRGRRVPSRSGVGFAAA